MILLDIWVNIGMELKVVGCGRSFFDYVIFCSEM